MERWGESMAGEIAPFGLGVTILVTGTYDTDIITDAGTTDDRDFNGPYARLHQTMNSRGRFAMKFARPPERFTDGLVKALADRGAFRRHGVGPMRRCCWRPTECCRPRVCTTCPELVLGIPRQGAMRGGAYPLTTAQRAMVFAAKVLPQPVVLRLASLAMRLSPAKPAADSKAGAMTEAPKVTFESRMMIDGKLVDGEAGTFTNINPANEDVLGEVADASKADMHRAIDAARRVVRRHRLVDQPPTAQALPLTAPRGDRG